MLERQPLDFVRQAFYVVRAGERIHRVGDSRFVCQYLLRSQGELDGFFGRQRQRLVFGVDVQRLRPAEYRGERLYRGSDDVVVGLLSGESHAGGLGVESASPRARVVRAEALAHYLRPHAPRGSELGDFLEQMALRHEEET